MGDRGLDPRDGAHDVDFEASAPGIVVHRLGERADIGDEDVKAAEMSRRLADPAPQRRDVGHVDRPAIGLHTLPGERGCRGVDPGLAARTDRYVAALLRQEFGDRAADAAAAAGDDGFLALETHIDSPPPLQRLLQRQEQCRRTICKRSAVAAILMRQPEETGNALDTV